MLGFIQEVLIGYFKETPTEIFFLSRMPFLMNPEFSTGIPFIAARISIGMPAGNAPGVCERIPHETLSGILTRIL